MNRSTIRIPLLLSPLLLAACATVPAPAEVAPEAPPPPAARELVAQVRAAAEADDALDVAPLRDPQLEDLRESAIRLEQEGKYRAAGRRVAEALELAPDHPELLQHAAELALHRRDWDQAVIHAGRSYEVGPRLGPLCRRNWATVKVVREALGQEEAAQLAHERMEACTVARPVRM